MSNKPKHFLIMAGGTGGHVFPGLAVAMQLQSAGNTVSWLGTRTGIESDLVPKAGIAISYIKIAGVRGKGKLGFLMAPLKILLAISQSICIFRRIKPDCVLGMGGFVAGPGAIAAKLTGIPLVIHEQNAIPGTTNKILAKMANKVLAAFPHAFAENVHAEVVGNPVRPGFSSVNHMTDNERPLHLLVVGGSLGAKAINNIIPELINTLDFQVELLHQTGKAHFEQVKSVYGNNYSNVQVVPFIEDMVSAFGWADIVICRSGAMTVSELAVAGLPAIFIPYPFAIDDHQTANAKWMANAGAAIVMPQREMTVVALKNILIELNTDRQKLKEMKNNAAAIGINDASERVAAYCVELAQ